MYELANCKLARTQHANRKTANRLTVRYNAENGDYILSLFDGQDEHIAVLHTDDERLALKDALEAGAEKAKLHELPFKQLQAMAENFGMPGWRKMKQEELVYWLEGVV